MGAVYEALDEELDRKVAIKVIRRVVDERTRVKAMGEAQALARLNHPNVVAIHDVGLAHRRVWMAMELVKGPTLAAWAAKRTRGWAECLRVLTDAARGVAAAHAADIVHSDLKPTNVMIGEDDRVRLLADGRRFVEAEHSRVTLRDCDVPSDHPMELRRSVAGAELPVLGMAKYGRALPMGEGEFAVMTDAYTLACVRLKA